MEDDLARSEDLSFEGLVPMIRRLAGEEARSATWLVVMTGTWEIYGNMELDEMEDVYELDLATLCFFHMFFLYVGKSVLKN